MLILSNVLALALIVADEPRPAPPPIVVQGHLTGTITGVGSSDAPASGAPVGASNLPATMPKITKPHTSGNEEADEIWNLTLPDAIKIGLDNSEVVRVISMGAQGIPLSNFDPNPPEDVKPPADSSVLIARLNADASVWNFKAAIMAHVRSIEQQYWELSHQQVVLWSRETAVRLAEEILRRERAGLKVGKAAPADVAETELQLENYQLNLVTATSDVITTERQLRNILGLPPADHRRIVPSTAPTEARLEPDWEISVRQMLESQPDIAQQRVMARLSEINLLLARNQLLPPLGMNTLHELTNLGDRLDEVGAVPGLPAMIRQDAAIHYPVDMDPAEPGEPEFVAHKIGMSYLMPISVSRAPLANTRQAQYHLLRQRATLQQITHQTTHSLARFFLEIDANYKQFRTARRLRTASQQQLEAQRAFYEAVSRDPALLIENR